MFCMAVKHQNFQLHAHGIIVERNLLFIMLIQENAEFGVREMLLDIASKAKVFKLVYNLAVCYTLPYSAMLGVYWFKCFTCRRLHG